MRNNYLVLLHHGALLGYTLPLLYPLGSKPSKLSSMRHSKISILLTIACVLTAGIGGYAIGRGHELILRTESSQYVAHPDLDLAAFWQLWSLVEQKYVDTSELNNQKMLYGAMKGVVRALGDPFSEFLSPQESEEFMDSLEGSLTGVGMEVGIRNDSLVVISPIRGSPADRAGMRPGDHIFKIDGALASDFSIFEAVKRIRGPIGTEVTLTIFRDGETAARDVKIVRERVEVASVTTDLRSDGIAVVTVATFGENTATDFAKQLTDLQAKNVKGIVLDFRFNGGGFLDAAVEMVSSVLAQGNVVLIKERGVPDRTTPVTGRVILPTIPLVVLINGGSASASEIFAGALQDAKRATIVGEKSFGKGTVQELVKEFVDGSTLRITVARWFTPSGRNVTKDAIKPDVEVKITPADVDAKKDPQLERAVEILNSKLKGINPQGE